MILSVCWTQADAEDKMQAYSKTYTQGVVSIDIPPNQHSMAGVVDVRSLSELVLVRPEQSDDLTFVLSDGEGSALRCTCRWE